MLTSFPHDYPKPNGKKRSSVFDIEPHWTKRSKQQHASTLISVPQSIPSTSFQSTAQKQQQQQQKQQQQRSFSLEKSTVNAMDDPDERELMDVMMLDDMGLSCIPERIDDMEKYLGDDDIDNNRKDESLETTDNQSFDIYTLLERQHRPLTAILVNGVLLPMEQQQGGTKHCIPEFVLRSPNSTTRNKSNLATHLNPLPMDQVLQTQPFMLGNDDSMDID